MTAYIKDDPLEHSSVWFFHKIHVVYSNCFTVSYSIHQFIKPLFFLPDTLISYPITTEDVAPNRPLSSFTQTASTAEGLLDDYRAYSSDLCPVLCALGVSFLYIHGKVILLPYVTERDYVLALLFYMKEHPSH